MTSLTAWSTMSKSRQFESNSRPSAASTSARLTVPVGAAAAAEAGVGVSARDARAAAVTATAVVCFFMGFPPQSGERVSPRGLVRSRGRAGLVGPGIFPGTGPGEPADRRTPPVGWERGQPSVVPSRAGVDPDPAGRLPLPRRAGPGDLRRQGEEPPLPAVVVLPGHRQPPPAHGHDGHHRRVASSGPWSRTRSRRCSWSTPGSRSSTRASTSSTATTSPTPGWRSPPATSSRG